MITKPVKRLLAVILASTVIGSATLVSFGTAAVSSQLTVSAAAAETTPLIDRIAALPQPVKKTTYKYVLCQDSVIGPGDYLIVNPNTATVMPGTDKKGSIYTLKPRFGNDFTVIDESEITDDCIYSIQNAPNHKYYIKNRSGKYLSFVDYVKLAFTDQPETYSTFSIDHAKVKKTVDGKDVYENTPENYLVIHTTDSKGTKRSLGMYKSALFSVYDHAQNLDDSRRFMFLYKKVKVKNNLFNTSGLYDALTKAKEQLYVTDKVKADKAFTSLAEDAVTNYQLACAYMNAGSQPGSDVVNALQKKINKNTSDLLSMIDNRNKQTITVNKKTKKISAYLDEKRTELENNIVNLFAESDYSGYTLTGTANKTVIDNLSEEAGYLSVSEKGRTLLEKAQKLITNKIKKDTAREFKPERNGDMRAYADTVLKANSMGTNKQVTGIWASAYDTLNVYVSGDKEEIKKYPPKLYFTQNISYELDYEYPLEPGLNTIKVPLLKKLTTKDDYENGGMVYILNPYTKEQQKSQVSIYIEGGNKVPLYKKGKSSANFLTSLNNYAAHLKNNEKGYHDIVELCSDYSFMTFTITDILDTVNSKVTCRVKDKKTGKYVPKEMDLNFNTAVSTWDELVKDFFKFGGISNEADYKNVKIQIRTKSMPENYGAYAIPESINIKAPDANKVLKGEFNWGLPHELGHCVDNPERKHSEVTNNMWAMMNVLNNGLYEHIAISKNNSHYNINRVAADEVAEKDRLWKVKNDYCWGLFIFWDLEVYSSGYWPAFNKMYLNGTSGNTTVDKLFASAAESATTSEEKETLKNEKIAVYSSIATKKDLTRYFTRYGFISEQPSATYTNAMKELKLTPLDKPIWYYSTTAYADIRNSSRNSNKSVSGKFSFNMDKNNTLYFNLSGRYPDAHMGYEILRNGKIIGFTWDNSFKLNSSAASGTITVKAYDRMLNVYATSSAEYSALKTSKKLSPSLSVTPEGADFSIYSMNLGRTVTLRASASNGIGNYTYKFETINKSKGNQTVTVCDFSTKSSVNWKPEVYGDYTVRVTVKDKTGATSITTFPFTFTPNRGDINGNGSIDIYDATLVRQYVTKKTTLDKYQLTAADVDFDGKVTSKDADHIQEYAVSLISAFNGLSTYSVQLPAIEQTTEIKLKTPVAKDKFSVKVNISNSSYDWLIAAPKYDASNEKVVGFTLHNYFNTTNARTATVTVKIEGGTYTVNVSQKKYILNSRTTIISSNITLGDTITIKPDTLADYGPCEYKIIYKKTGTTGTKTLCNYSSKPATTFKPVSYGEYKLCVYSKDTNNKTTSKTFTIKVNLKKGDVDGNGVVDIRDATAMQRALAEIIKLDEYQKTAADVNNDGYFSISDVSALQKKLAEL